MMMSATNETGTEGNFGVHPKKFMLWLGMASITMFFAVTTSALLVKKGDQQYWMNFELPKIFMVSTLVVVASSAAMQAALNAFRKERFSLYRKLLTAASVSGVLFLIMQYVGWNAMQSMGIFLDGNASGSFIYVLSGAHGLHIVGGLIALLIAMYKAHRARRDPLFEIKHILNPKQVLSLEILTTYWHFVNIVWVYLFVFFYFNYQ